MPTRAIEYTKNTLHALFPIVGAARYGIPGAHMEIIGITGTDGKSSSVELTAAMSRAAGLRVAHFSSISYSDGTRTTPNTMKMTTPGQMELHRFLRRAMENGCMHAVLEITSQGMLQHRHRMIGFSLVGITNITPEHIEAHGGFEQYRRMKASIVDALKDDHRGLVIDADTHAAIDDVLKRNVRIHKTNEGELQARILESSLLGSLVELRRGSEHVRIESRLGGPFAPKNIIFAAHMASHCGVPLYAMKQAVEAITIIPGRFEIISQNPLIIVDYAHTIHALETLLPYVRSVTKGRLIHVFGAAGGGRDRYKRPLIARISEASADVSVLSEENSFDEPVQHILNEIQSGFSPKHEFYRYPRREDAVRFAYSLLQSPEDTLLLTAKGSETVIAGPNGSKRPYEERVFVRCLEQSSFAQ